VELNWSSSSRESSDVVDAFIAKGLDFTHIDECSREPLQFGGSRRSGIVGDLIGTHSLSE
jgi:hypothetical protein